MTQQPPASGSPEPYDPNVIPLTTRIFHVAAAFACMAANLLSVVADHFDKRDNERSYRRFARITSWVGWISFGLSLVIYLVQGVSGSGPACSQHRNVDLDRPRQHVR